MNCWFTELQTDHMKLSCRVKKVLCEEKTPFQHLAVYDTVQFGRMLALDDVIQTTVKDEFVYHEMIAHVGLNTHPNPRRVLVIGGGDGGSIREILKHSSVEQATLVEIDERVIAAAREYLPEISCALDDPRVRVIVDDGIKHVKENRNTYDMIIVDSTDPVGPAEGLFGKAFYQDVHDALTEDGLFVAQTESPFFNQDIISRVFRDIRSIFPITRLFLACVPTYPGGLWSFTMGSKKYDPRQVNVLELPDLKTKYYSPAIHRAAFELPPFVAELVEQG
ncbi:MULTISPECIES: polyamine aminopropyltransferase [Desulfofundulus]|uniref:Polyamine aminopropyltransferase n=1 Tax=Desulfofundulus thermosubterraneus DSM 16057 TaxID=1121432 RepID=A0A1M6L4E5_9FIRM|nr:MULTISPECIES: polyamine aminopropyltransferase [Desulfofundulus]NHM25871.1 polyamine aminopropyltransferase [Desulfofundulus sp. TPOSR]QSS05751.1 polyamine aminopropyltransferase [Klebsiella pneumoniae]SHJ66067.1 spermidine synthase [Desulfofundulus thermosubterraneus DSM 16057]